MKKYQADISKLPNDLIHRIVLQVREAEEKKEQSKKGA